MEFGLAFRYAIDRTGGWTNVLLITVCFLIPIVGPIVMMGYRAEVAEALIRDPDLRRHPLFKFDRFAEYLSRGVWAFLIALVVSIPFIILIVAAMMIGMVLDMQQAGRGGPPVMTFVLYGIAYVVGLPLTMVFSIPMTFQAELTARFDLAGALRGVVLEARRRQGTRCRHHLHGDFDASGVRRLAPLLRRGLPRVRHCVDGGPAPPGAAVPRVSQSRR